MIRLYRDKAKFDRESILLDNESFFMNNVSAKWLGDASLRVMNKIDGASLLDANTGTIQTPYGVTDINNLSTGCKTVLNYIFIKENRERYKDVLAIDATECGWNSLEELFRAIEEGGYDIGVILEHRNKLLKCSKRTYKVDDCQVIDSLFKF